MDDDRKVAEWYDKLSSSYDELYGEEQAQKHTKVLDHIGNEKITTILDVGCGTGRFLERASHLYSYGIGVDVSRQMLLLAKRRRSPKTDFVQATFSRLPIKNKVVDCTISVSTAKADATVSGFMEEAERIGTDNSVLVMTLFDQPIDSEKVPKSGVHSSQRINDRETLYVYKLFQTGSKR